MRRFDYSFLKTSALDADIFSQAFNLGRFTERSSFRQTEYPAIFTELVNIAKYQSVKGSNAIEGIITSDSRIQSLMEHKTDPLNHDEMEIAGYRDALEYIHNNHSRLFPDESLIRELHRIIGSYTGEEGGNYKESDNLIVEVDADGKRRIHFVPTPAKDTPEAMEQAVLALIDAWQDSGISRLLLIPCFILDFLSIHPFPDGNGRVSRLLSLLLMYNCGMDVGKYISFEEKINSSKERYYRALTQSSEGWAEGENDYTPFIRYYLDTLFLCYRDLDSRFATVAKKKVNKTNRVEAVILNSIVPISKREILSILPDISESTVEAVIGSLVRNGTVEVIGRTRSARYRRKIDTRK